MENGGRPSEGAHEVLLDEEEAAYAEKDGSCFLANDEKRERAVGKEFSSLDDVVTPEVLDRRFDSFLGARAPRAS